MGGGHDRGCHRHVDYSAVVSDLVFNPFGFSQHDDPYAAYKRMRDEAPLYWNDELRAWASIR